MTKPRRYIHDDSLGYRPRPGHAEPGLTIDGDGFRGSDPTPPGRLEAPLLAVGDSFTFGDGVSDRETWPAQLQRLSGHRVLNGGVSGYGFDQIVLRAESLAAAVQPSLIIVGFIADDILRTELKRLWWRDKPWFALERGQLVLNGLPVRNRALSALRPLLRPYELLLRHAGPDLQHWLRYHVRVHPRGSGETIGRGLTKRLAALQCSSGARVLVVALYDGRAWQDDRFAAEQRRITGSILEAARAEGLAVVDSFPVLAAVPDRPSMYNAWHMSARGYRIMARLIAAALDRERGSVAP